MLHSKRTNFKHMWGLHSTKKQPPQSPGQNNSKSGHLQIVVKINGNGRIVIPKEIRRILDIEGETAKLTIHSNGRSAQTVVDIDEFGRATVPINVRQYLDIEGVESTLKIEVCSV